MILAIDPGPERSAWVMFVDCRPYQVGMNRNDDVLAMIRAFPDLARGRILIASHPLRAVPVVIEKVESFGMPVGAEVFETVYWSGRFAEAAHPLTVGRIGRKAVKVALCGSAKAKDPNVRQALIDRYGGKDTAIGRKATPGPLYGVTGDVWSALAVAVAWSEGAR